MKAAINCIQPFILHTMLGLIAVAHNGELVNAGKKRALVLREGIGLSTDTDSELIGQMISKTIAQNMKCRGTLESGDISRELSASMSEMDLSYSLLVMTHDRIYALRDPYGNRPLCIGTLYTTNTMQNCIGISDMPIRMSFMALNIFHVLKRKLTDLLKRH
jgi:amidophosphoribosyltransferase